MFGVYCVAKEDARMRSQVEKDPDWPFLDQARVFVLDVPGLMIKS